MIINDDLIGRALLIGCVMVACVTSAVGAAWAAGMDDSSGFVFAAAFLAFLVSAVPSRRSHTFLAHVASFLSMWWLQALLVLAPLHPHRFVVACFDFCPRSGLACAPSCLRQSTVPLAPCLCALLSTQMHLQPRIRTTCSRWCLRGKRSIPRPLLARVMTSALLVLPVLCSVAVLLLPANAKGCSTVVGV